MAATPGEKTSVAYIFSSDTATVPLTSTDVSYNVGDSTVIQMTQTVDRGTNNYYSGDPIDFFITIENTSSGELTELVFKTTMDSAVIPAGEEGYTITTTSGTIASKVNPIKITGINVTANSTVSIKISGVIE